MIIIYNYNISSFPFLSWRKYILFLNITCAVCLALDNQSVSFPWKGHFRHSQLCSVVCSYLCTVEPSWDSFSGQFGMFIAVILVQSYPSSHVGEPLWEESLLTLLGNTISQQIQLPKKYSNPWTLTIFLPPLLQYPLSLRFGSAFTCSH